MWEYVIVGSGSVERCIGRYSMRRRKEGRKEERKEGRKEGRKDVKEVKEGNEER